MTNKVTILDGGMGRQLKAMGAPFRQPEWSALALMNAPETVIQAHHSFIDAGAEIITTNTYAVVPFHIGQDKFDNDAEDLISLAANIARQAADGTTTHDVKVAGCLPPAFGSYRPDLFDADKAESIYRPLIDNQKDDIDFWLAETISSIEEAQTIAKLVKDTDKPFWLSYTLTDRSNNSEAPSLKSSDDIKDAVNAAIKMGVEALLFNCSQPEEIAPVFEIIQSMNVPFKYGAYANTFPTENKSQDANAGLTELREDITPEEYLNYAQKWQSLGATVIGGCCGIGPEHIAMLQKLNT